MKTRPCDHCGGELDAGARIWYDRHGDPYGVCSTCYERLLHPLRPVRPTMLRVAAWAAMAAGALLILANLAGCATLEPRTERVMVGDRLVTIQTDDPSAPPECGQWNEPWVGCWVGQFSTIYLKSPVKLATLEHEMDHAAGMFHGQWLDYPAIRKRCAEVILGGRRYQAGQMICLDLETGTEETWSDRQFTRLLRAVS